MVTEWDNEIGKMYSLECTEIIKKGALYATSLMVKSAGFFVDNHSAKEMWT
jgi:hypothetical protein